MTETIQRKINLGCWWLGCLCLILGSSHPLLADTTVQVTIRDRENRATLPARIYLTSEEGKAYFFNSASPDGSAVRYEKQNWINSRSVEYHTTVSAHPCLATVPPGRYQLTVEHGKCYRTWSKSIEFQNPAEVIDVELIRWCDPQSLGWYSGDTHLHRTIDELKNVVLAEDLNIALPLTSWVTYSDTPPATGDKTIDDARLSSLIEVDPNHLIWPRSTEYEIFTVGRKQHTLGALFVLGHQDRLQSTVPPWRPLVEALAASEPNVLYDMDKLDWPFAMVLPTLVPNALYELSNNHTWRTEFAFRDWNSSAPPHLHPPWGGKTGGHRQWLDYTHGMYYTLLNTGLRLPPSAGTANGVHPVPAGFGRVYVQMSGKLRYEDWMEGLKAGRSFVTTGPMLYAQADGQHPGHLFSWKQSDAKKIMLKLEVQSEEPLLYGEVLINGRPEHLLRAHNTPGPGGSFQTRLEQTIEPRRSGWFSVRFWEKRPDGQVRFVHSAPWYVDIDHKPVEMLRSEKEYLIGRMRSEIARSADIVSTDAMNEYVRALEFYDSIPVLDDQLVVDRNARPWASEVEGQRWLDNMIIDHRYSADEIRQASGLPHREAEAAILQRKTKPEEKGIRLRPYPGGRHPRRSFLDGALEPQRETKVSVFPSWEEGGYAVVDVPEAIFSNLGLTYLAHRHVPTIWDDHPEALTRLEWSEVPNGLMVRRELPNGIAFRSVVTRRLDGVDMRIELTNGTKEPLTGLRVQVCTMLNGLTGFNLQEPWEEVSKGSWIAIRSTDRNRWLATSWTPNHRTWQNPPVPCIHSDPIFPDCQPGQTVEVRGVLKFYEGQDVESIMTDQPP